MYICNSRLNGISIAKYLRGSSGGLELMFGDKASHNIRPPSKVPGTTEPANIKYLLNYLCDELMTDIRKELFVLDDTMYEFYPFLHFLHFLHPSIIIAATYIYTGPTTMLSYTHSSTTSNFAPLAVPVS